MLRDSGSSIYPLSLFSAIYTVSPKFISFLGSSCIFTYTLLYIRIRILVYYSKKSDARGRPIKNKVDEKSLKNKKKIDTIDFRRRRRCERESFFVDNNAAAELAAKGKPSSPRRRAI